MKRYSSDRMLHVAIMKLKRWRMLDLTGIVFSSVMMLIVIVRAVQLDRTQAWFQKVKLKEAAISPGQHAWKRQG